MNTDEHKPLVGLAGSNSRRDNVHPCRILFVRLLAWLGLRPRRRKLVPAFAEPWSPAGYRSMKLHLGQVNGLDPDRRWS